MTQQRSKLLDLLLDSPYAKISSMPDVDIGQAEVEPFPFLAIVGQKEMKLALLLSLINPKIGGILLIGPRGTAKTTAVRSLIDLLPTIRRSLCVHGCSEERLDAEGMDGICEDCREKVGYGEPLTVADKVRIIELPLNARLDDVVGGINERVALEQRRVILERGILANADNNILYIDEVNLLDDAITDAILDASAQGHYTVRRGPMRLQYRSRIILIGSMNPEEGRLRPQIMDRFGLRALVTGLEDEEMRYRVYEHAMMYQSNAAHFASLFASNTLDLAQEVEDARARLPNVTIEEDAKKMGLMLIKSMKIDSNRAEITLFEAARAHAAADEREVATVQDIKAVALLSLRQRQSDELDSFMDKQSKEDEALTLLIEKGADG
ncbi:MAG: magnesium chelatase [Chloroflexota bacterium]